MPASVPPLMILQEIRKALGPDFPIFIDCGIESGLDVYKCLALGATAEFYEWKKQGKEIKF